MADEWRTFAQTNPKTSVGRVHRRDFAAWMAAKYRNDDWQNELQRAVPTNPGATLTEKARYNAKRLASIFFDEKIAGDLGANFKHTFIHNYVEPSNPGDNLGLANQRGPNWVLASTRLQAWMDARQAELWDIWLDSLGAGHARRNPISEASATWQNEDRNAVAAEAYLIVNGVAQKIGNTYSAQMGDGNDHAEIQWKDAHENAFLAGLARSTRAEFHISRVTCGPCAEVFIEWWKNTVNARLPGGFQGAYIYTYKDPGNHKLAYELDDRAVFRIHTWG